MRVDLLDRFEILVGPAKSAVPVFDAAMTFAAALQDGDVWPEARERRHALEAGVAADCERFEEPADIVEGVLAYMRRHGFHGDIHSYEDPRNSLMDRVLERRLGLPITLSALAIHLAERCGVELHGIGFPGHFLVGLKVEDDEPEPGTRPASCALVWDPFRGGRRLPLDELAALFTSVVGEPVEPDSDLLSAHLVPCHSRMIVTRMLENLRRHFRLANENERVVDTLELLAVLHPDVPKIRQMLAEHPRQRHLLN